MKHWASTALKLSFDTSVTSMKGVPSNLGACRTGSSSRVCLSLMKALVCFTFQYGARLWSCRNWWSFRFPLCCSGCGRSRLHCKSVSGAAMCE